MSMSNRARRMLAAPAAQPGRRRAQPDSDDRHPQRLVSFLLVYSTEVEVVQNTKGIEIPQSISEQRPRETVVVMLTKDELFVQGERVASHRRGARQHRADHRAAARGAEAPDADRRRRWPSSEHRRARDHRDGRQDAALRGAEEGDEHLHRRGLRQASRSRCCRRTSAVEPERVAQAADRRRTTSGTAPSTTALTNCPGKPIRRTQRRFRRLLLIGLADVPGDGHRCCRCIHLPKPNAKRGGGRAAAAGAADGGGAAQAAAAEADRAAEAEQPKPEPEARSRRKPATRARRWKSPRRCARSRTSWPTCATSSTPARCAARRRPDQCRRRRTPRSERSLITSKVGQRLQPASSRANTSRGFGSGAGALPDHTTVGDAVPASRDTAARSSAPPATATAARPRAARRKSSWYSTATRARSTRCTRARCASEPDLQGKMVLRVHHRAGGRSHRVPRRLAASSMIPSWSTRSSRA